MTTTTTDTAAAPAVVLGPAEIAARTAARIRAEPHRHDQGHWAIYGHPDIGPIHIRHVYQLRANLDLFEPGGCGTAACAAGWAVTEALRAGMDLGNDGGWPIWVVAARLLDIPRNDTCGELHRLFRPTSSRETVLAILDRIAAGETDT